MRPRFGSVGAWTASSSVPVCDTLSPPGFMPLFGFCNGLSQPLNRFLPAAAAELRADARRLLAGGGGGNDAGGGAGGDGGAVVRPAAAAIMTSCNCDCTVKAAVAGAAAAAILTSRNCDCTVKASADGLLMAVAGAAALSDTGKAASDKDGRHTCSLSGYMLIDFDGLSASAAAVAASLIISLIIEPIF